MLLVVKGDNLNGGKNPNPTKHGPIKGGGGIEGGQYHDSHGA